MNRKVVLGKKMYAIFSNKNKTYVQSCKVVEILKNGFVAQCHNGGNGLEFFDNISIGNGVYFSKDSAELKLKEKIKSERYLSIQVKSTTTYRSGG